MATWQPKPFKVAESSLAEPWEEAQIGQRADFQSLAVGSGYEFKRMAQRFVEEAGGQFVMTAARIGPYPIDGIVQSPSGRQFYLLARGTPDEGKLSGLRRVDTVQKLGFVAMQLKRRSSTPVLVVTSDLPRGESKAGQYLADLADDVWDVVAVRGDLRGFNRLRSAFDGSPRTPLDAAWTTHVRTLDVARQSSFFDE